jgi:hypothetical protein
VASGVSRGAKERLPQKGAGGTGLSFSEGNSQWESDARRKSTVDTWAGGNRSREGSVAPVVFVEVSAISQAFTARCPIKSKHRSAFATPVGLGFRFTGVPGLTRPFGNPGPSSG